MKRTHLLRVMIVGISAFPAIPLDAQISMGTRMGLSLSRIEPRSKDLPDAVRLMKEQMVATQGFDVTMPVEIIQGAHFAIQPELGVVMKGMSFDGPDGYHNELRLNYAELAILFKGRIEWGRIRGEAFLGPGFAYALTARSITSATSTSLASDGMVRQDDLGFPVGGMNICSGVGVSYRKGVPTFFLNYRYVYGLTDVLGKGFRFTDINGSTVGSIQGFTRSSVFSIGMLVPLKRPAAPVTP